MSTNIEKFLLCKECVKERGLQIKLEEEKKQENFIAYVEDYFQLTPSDEQKEIRELHQDFKKQTYNLQTTSHHYTFCEIFKHSNGIASTIYFKCNRKLIFLLIILVAGRGVSNAMIMIENVRNLNGLTYIMICFVSL